MRRWKLIALTALLSLPVVVFAVIGMRQRPDDPAALVRQLGDEGIPLRERLIWLYRYARTGVRLRTILRHGDYAAMKLAAMGPQAVPLLVEVLETSDEEASPKARGRAACVLGLIGTPEAREALERAVWEQDERIAASATDALMCVRTPEATKALVRIAREHESEDVRGSAVHSLSFLGNQGGMAEAREALDSIAADPDVPEDTRKSARFWIDRAGGRRPGAREDGR